MRFDRESYRKLYVAESAEHRLLSLFARGLRDYLLRFATEDGTLLPGSKRAAEDLCRVLGASSGERRHVLAAVEELIGVGYLTLDPNGRLWITRYVEAQQARSPGALRQQRYRDNHPRVTRNVTDDVTPPVTNNVTSNRRDLVELADESSARAHEGPADSESEPKLTICPLNLQEKAESVGIVRDFVEKYSVEPSQIREAVREFVTYWTIGEGIGRKHANWPKKLRKHLQLACERLGGLQAPGAIAHAQQQPKRGKGGAPAALVEVLPAPYHETWKEPDWMKS